MGLQHVRGAGSQQAGGAGSHAGSGLQQHFFLNKQASTFAVKPSNMHPATNERIPR